MLTGGGGVGGGEWTWILSWIGVNMIYFYIKKHPNVTE